jgi:antitoxin (DNA-binding transcriptional repressor) of toxin-antitoxin stability system
MAVIFNIAETEAKLSGLVVRAEAGEDVVIARDGVAGVVLKPMARRRKRPCPLCWTVPLVLDPEPCVGQRNAFLCFFSAGAARHKGGARACR